MHTRLESCRCVVVQRLVPQLTTSRLRPGQRHGIKMASLPHGHGPQRRRPCLLGFGPVLKFLLEVRHFVVEVVLKPPAEPPFGLGHGSDGIEFLEQGVSPEGPLYRQSRRSCFLASVLPFQHFDLFIQEVLRQFVPEENNNCVSMFAFEPNRKKTNRVKFERKNTNGVCLDAKTRARRGSSSKKSFFFSSLHDFKII